VFIVLIVSLIIVVVACNDNEENTGNKYYYYPQKNVYYDVNQQKFYYSVDGSKSWQTFTGIADTDVLPLGEKVEIYSNDTLIYKDNDNHRKLYEGRLYNLNIANTDLVSVVPAVVSERRTSVKKIPVAKEKKEEKTKKGFGKILGKIFGKKEKK